MYYSVPRETGIVDDVDFPVAEFGGAGDESGDVGGVEHVSRNSDGAAAAGGYGGGDGKGFF